MVIALGVSSNRTEIPFTKFGMTFTKISLKK